MTTSSTCLGPGTGLQPRAVSVYIYDRHSTPDRDALRSRLEACSAFARAQDWDVAGWYVDSGSDALSDDSRPGLDRLLGSLARGPGDDRRLLIYDWTRLSNDIVTVVRHAKRVHDDGGSICTVRAGGDTPDAHGGRLGSLVRIP